MLMYSRYLLSASGFFERIFMTLLYSLVQMLFWAAYAIVYGYVSVYLLGSGFSSTLEGTIVALSAVFAALLQPYLAEKTDRAGGKAVKKVLFLLSLLFLLVVILLFVMKPEVGFGHVMTGVLYCAAILLLQAATPFVYSLGTVSARSGLSLNYGLARGLGSAGYSIASFLAGRAINKVGIKFIPGGSIILLILLLVVVLVFPFPDAARVTESEEERAAEKKESFFKKYPQFALVILGTVCLYTTHMMVNTFGFQIVTSKGGGNAELGVGTALAALTEIPVNIIFGHFQKKVKPKVWFIVSGLFYVVRAAGYLFLPSVGGYYAMQFLQLSSWVVIGIVSIFYVSSVMAPEDEVKGQAFFTMALSVATVVSSLIGGPLIDSFGISAMLTVSLASAIAGTLIIAAAFLKRRKV